MMDDMGGAMQHEPLVRLNLSRCDGMSRTTFRRFEPPQRTMMEYPNS